VPAGRRGYVATEVDRLDGEGGGRNDPRLIDAYGGVSPHGESFLALVLHRFGANGLR
jgi:hypothetical protein